MADNAKKMSIWYIIVAVVIVAAAIFFAVKSPNSPKPLPDPYLPPPKYPDTDAHNHDDDDDSETTQPAETGQRDE